MQKYTSKDQENQQNKEKPEKRLKSSKTIPKKRIKINENPFKKLEPNKKPRKIKKRQKIYLKKTKDNLKAQKI